MMDTGISSLACTPVYSTVEAVGLCSLTISQGRTLALTVLSQGVTFNSSHSADKDPVLFSVPLHHGRRGQ